MTRSRVDLRPGNNPLGEQLFDVSVAQGEAEIEPNRVLDDLRQEAVAAIGEQSPSADANL
jgi:hypothetical protein